jgi:hypothetical protein
MIELQSPHHAWTKILHQYVRGRDQPADRLRSTGRLQIQHQAVLADIELAEGGRAIIPHRRAGPHCLAFLGLDLDNLCSHVGEHSCTMGSGNRG